MNVLHICVLQWDQYNKRMLKLLETMEESDFHKAIVPGGNSPSWILGHLVDTDDALLELLGIGKRHFPDLQNIYHHTKGTNQEGHLSKHELIRHWKIISDDLDKAFKSWTENEWLSRHTAVNEEDFKKEPHRNKLNVMLGRVSHKASHLGQIAMMKK